MTKPIKDGIESVMAAIAEQTRQEQALYSLPAEEQPGRDDGPPKFYGPPEWDFTIPGEREEYLKSADGRREVNLRRHAESLPVIAPMDILSCLDKIPSKREFIIDGYIPAGTCGLLIGTGGAGKSFLALLAAMVVSSGRTIDPFFVSAPRAVVIVNVEDDHDDINRRMYRIAEEYGFSQAEKEIMAGNLFIFPARGQVGPLMELQNQNPRPTVAAEWLRAQLDQLNPGLVILDTKSRLYGLDENSNDHATQWLGLLESLLVDHPTTSIVVVTHTAKASATTGDHHSNRGASSIGDNCRFGMALTWLSDDEAKAMGIKDPGAHIKLTHTKASYSKQLDPVIFRKNDFGVPVMLDIDTSGQLALGNALNILIEVLRQDYPEGVNKRELERGEKDCKSIKEEVVGVADIPKKDWPKVVALGIESARLEEVEDTTSLAKNKPVNVRVRQSEQHDLVDDEITQYQLFQTVTNCHGRKNNELELS
jgi:replicative DNA helicase